MAGYYLYFLLLQTTITTKLHILVPKKNGQVREKLEVKIMGGD